MRCFPFTLLLAFTFAFASNACIERRAAYTERQQSPVTAQLRFLTEEDQKVRGNPQTSRAELAALSLRQRQSIYKLLAQALIKDVADLHMAAGLLQHGGDELTKESLLLAHYLAMEAVAKGEEEAKLLAAATIDRYLILNDHPQRYGTQYFKDRRGRMRLYPIERSTTDSERVAWNVPPLDSSKISVYFPNQDTL